MSKMGNLGFFVFAYLRHGGETGGDDLLHDCADTAVWCGVRRRNAVRCSAVCCSAGWNNTAQDRTDAAAPLEAEVKRRKLYSDGNVDWDGVKEATRGTFEKESRSFNWDGSWSMCCLLSSGASGREEKMQ